VKFLLVILLSFSLKAQEQSKLDALKNDISNINTKLLDSEVKSPQVFAGYGANIDLALSDSEVLKRKSCGEQSSYLEEQQRLKDLKLIEEVKKKEPKGYKLIAIIDYQTSGMGLAPHQRGSFYAEATELSSDTYKKLQLSDVVYNDDNIGRKREFFNNTINGYINELGLDPKNPDHFEGFVHAFASLLDHKPYDHSKSENNETTSYSAFDALTSASKGGVCVDYSIWIGELMNTAGVEGFDVNEFKKNFNTYSYTTSGSAHTLGKIRNPHTGDVYYINYGEVLKLEEGALVPTNELMSIPGFTSKNRGLTTRRGKNVFNEDGSVTAAGDELSGVMLTPLGNEVQNIIYSDGDYQDQKIQGVSGVQPSQRVTLGARLEKRQDSDDKSKLSSYDLGVSYIQLDGIEGVDAQERLIVWGKRRSEVETKGSRRKYQIFMGGGTSEEGGSQFYLDMAAEYAKKANFDIKFLAPEASLNIEGFTGARAFGYASNMVDPRDEEVVELSFDGNIFANTGIRSSINLNKNVSFYGQGMLLAAPSPKNLSSYRGEDIVNPASYKWDTETEFTVGNRNRIPLRGNREIATDLSYRQRNNAFGNRNFTSFRLNYSTQKENSVYMYFNRSRFDDFTNTGANNFNQYGVGYRGKIFKGTTADVGASLVHFPQSNQKMIQGGVKITPQFKKKR
jgi:hypothetical protein